MINLPDLSGEALFYGGASQSDPGSDPAGWPPKAAREWPKIAIDGLSGRHNVKQCNRWPLRWRWRRPSKQLK